MLDEVTLKRVSTNYNRAVDAVEDILTDVLCATYERVTGKKASQRLQEAIGQAVRFNT